MKMNLLKGAADILFLEAYLCSNVNIPVQLYLFQKLTYFLT